jgi:integrase/recombinase XerD
MKQAPVLTDKDIKQLLGYLATTGYHPRNRCMLMLSWLTGMRVGEVASLKMGDVLTPAGEVRTEIQLKKHQTKGNEGRTVLLNSEARKELAKFLKTRHGVSPAN